MNYEVEHREDHVFIRCPFENISTSELESLKNILEDLSEENVILQLIAVRTIRRPENLKKVYDQYLRHDKSFIVIATPDLHEELELPQGAALHENEALEILEMEEIERKI